MSNWRLARAVASRGQLGVVSGTAIDSVLVRRLQDGDADGSVRRAMASFPLPEVAAAVSERYFQPEGRSADQPYRLLPMYRHVPHRARDAITMLASFVEVFLAREGHDGLVGMNLLTKVQRPNLATLYGAILAGVDVVLMGAGIPREIPPALAALATHQPATLRLELVGGSSDQPVTLTFDPQAHWDGATPPPLERPAFLAIVASNSLATMLVRKGGGIDGLVIEGPTAGGHNAPPRGEPQFNERGEPVYGTRDTVDYGKIAELGVPFWIAGGAGSPEALQSAQACGAAGIQVGTLFAYCDESGLRADLKRDVLRHAIRGDVDVFTDPLASPTGYPFKVVRWPGAPDATARSRICDLGYLRVAVRGANGRIDYRCPAEPVEAFVKKGGELEETEGRQCLCNALMANIGLGQPREAGATEPPLITSGDDLQTMSTFLAGRERYTADDVLGYLLGA